MVPPLVIFWPGARKLLLILSLLVPAATIAGGTALAASADWPQLKQNAARTGDQPTARLQLPLTQSLAVQFPAPIYASPAVVQGRVFIQDALGNMACVESSTNQVRWVTALGGINNMSSPAVSKGRVYVGSTAGYLYVLDAETGKILAQTPASGGVSAAPAVTPRGIYFSTLDGALSKIDRDGKLIWTHQGGRISINEFAVRGDEVLWLVGKTNTYIHRLLDKGDAYERVEHTGVPGNCCPQSGPCWYDEQEFSFTSFDSESGRFYVRRAGAFSAHQDACESRAVPSYRNGRLYRGDKCIELTKRLTLAWRVNPDYLYDGGFHSSPALAKDLLVVGSERGHVYFFDLEGEEKIRSPRWQFTTRGAGQPNGAVSSSPAVVDGGVYFGGEDGILYGLSNGPAVEPIKLPAAQHQAEDLPQFASDRLTGHEWVTPGGDMGFSFSSDDPAVKPPFATAWKTRVWSVFKCPMVVADGRVYAAGRGGPLLALDAGTGQILWKTHHAGVESRMAPTFIDGRLVLGRIRGGRRDSPYVRGASGGPPGEGIWCHDARTGRTLWHVPMPLKYHFNHDGLAVAEGRVFVTNTDDEGRIYAAALSLQDGSELWRSSLTELAGDQTFRSPPRFSGVIADGVWAVSVSDLGTVALDPRTGRVLWSDPRHFITRRTRIAARDKTLVVFTEKSEVALSPVTGKLLWESKDRFSSYSQALSDVFLASQGKAGRHPGFTCAWPIHCNGHWFVHESFARSHGANHLVCVSPTKPSDYGGALNPKQVSWRFTFLSNACPSPSPAYGRLYYSPNAEGVIYCFAPASETVGGD